MIKHKKTLNKLHKLLFTTLLLMAAICLCTVPAFAAIDVAVAVENTWKAAAAQIKAVTNNVIFPAVDTVLGIFFFVKLGTCYFDYRKSGQFEWTTPAILFACLVFMMTAPLYIWAVIGI